jgi:glycosyltransferase involved in cell wall biosynthesis
MRVLLVNSFHYPGDGVSTYTFGLAELLRQKGHEVAFFAMQDERNLPDPNSDLFVSPIDFRRLNQQKNILNGAKVLGRAIYSSEARKKFAQLMDRIQPDVIHIQNIHGHITPSILFESSRRKIRTVWTLHDYRLICPNSHFMLDQTQQICQACLGGHYYQPLITKCKKGSRLASMVASFEAYTHHALRIDQFVDQYLAPSDFLRSQFVKAGINPARIQHLPVFIPAEQLRSERAAGESPSDRQAGSQADSARDYILYYSRIEAVKGVHTLLQASRLAPEIRLVMAGRGDEHLIQQLRQQTNPNLTYIGEVLGSELHSLVQGARAVVMPSLWYENQPFTILEAFAAGKPVITSALGGMQELVAHEQRGLLAPPGDADSLAEAMRRIWRDPAQAHAWGQNGLEYLVQNHHPERHYEQLEGVYRGRQSD